SLNETFRRFKDLADKKHEIYDEDLLALVAETETHAINESIKLVSMKVSSATGEMPSASITLSVNGEEKTAIGNGDGQVDACFKAIESIVSSGAETELFSVNSITGGTDAQGEVN